MQGLLERGIIRLFFWWEYPGLINLLKKNLNAHRRRNHKTTIMYSLSLSFVVFLIVSYSLQLQNFYYQQEQSSGSYLRVGRLGRNSDFKLNAIPVVKELEQVVKNHPNVEAYSWASLPLSEVYSGPVETYVTNIGKIERVTTAIHAVSPNFLDVTIDKFYIPREPRASGHSLLSKLYSSEGSNSIILPSSYRDALAIQSPTHVLIGTKLPTENPFYHRLRPLAYLDSMPFFYMSKFRTDKVMDSLVSFPTFLRMTNGTLHTISDIPMESLNLKLKDGLTDKEIDDVRDKLARVTSKIAYLYIWDFRSATIRAKMSSELTLYFFGFAIAIAMIISFFSLLSSMFTNILEQSKEIAILRIVGVEPRWMYRLYIYEAFILVFVSSLAGTLIGGFSSWVLGLQLTLWNQFPVRFSLPWQFLLIVFSLSILCSFLASWRPIRRLMKMEASELLRRV